MPRSQHGGQPTSSGFGGFSSGGGPDAGFATSGGSMPKAPSAPNPYADVGKFNINVMSPSAFGSSVTKDVENSSIVHGLSEGIFGSHGGVFGGVPVLSTIGQAVGNIADFGVGKAGDVIGLAGQVPNPFGAAFTLANWSGSPETPEKAAMRKQMEGRGFDVLGILRDMSQYTADLDRKYADAHPDDMGPLGLYAINPELRQLGVNPLGGSNVGAMASGLFAGLFTPARLLSRSLAGFGGINGNMLETLTKRPLEELTAIQQEAVTKFKSGQWSNDKATDFLVRNNAGLSDNPFLNIAFESVLDPMVWGSFGAGALAKGAGAFGRLEGALEGINRAEQVGREIATGARTLEEVNAQGIVHMTESEAARSRAVLQGDKAAKAAAVEEINAEVKAGTLTKEQGALQIEDMQGRGFGPLEGFLSRTIGEHAWGVISDPVMGSIARKVHNVIDPTRLLFPEADPASRIMKIRLSTDSTAAATHAFGLFNVDKVYKGLEKFHPELIDKMESAFGGFTGGMTRVWAGNDISRTMLKKVETTFGDISQAIDTRMANLPQDFYTQLEHLVRDVTPLQTTPEGIAKRMAVAFGGEPQDYAEFLKGLNHDSRAYIHAATTHVAREELLDAVAKTSQAGTWKLPYGLEKLILMGPGELSKRRAAAFIRGMNQLTGPERIEAARAAVLQYDILRQSHVISGAKSVDKLVDHVKGLVKEGALAGDMREADLAKLDGPIGDWLGRFGASADGEPMYTLGFRPEDENLWRLIRDRDTGAVIGTAPWVDYVAERAPGFRPGYGRTLPGFAKKPADWLSIANSNLWHSISTQRVALEAERRFVQLGMKKLRMTEVEARRIHAVLSEEAREGESTMRGISGVRMWEKASEALPARLKSGENALTRRELVDTVLEAYKNELHIVGATQIWTGALKQYMDRIPIMNMAGGNYLGQISERLWPSLKFKFNPFFQFQESGEGQFFSILRGVRPYLRGEINQRDERAFRVWGKFDPNLEGVGDQLENSVSTLQGHISGTLQDATGIKRIKYVNASRQYRNTLGELGRTQMPKELMDSLRGKYGTMHDGDVMLRYLDEQMMENRSILDALEMGGSGVFDNIIKAADWTKPITLGAIAPLHMDEVARRMGVTSHGDLIRAVRSKSNPLTSSDVAERLLEMEANPDYVKRVVQNLEQKGLDKWWKQAQKAGNLTDAQARHLRAIERAAAAAKGMNESEWMSQRFTSSVRTFSDPASLPQTDDALLSWARQSQRDKGLPTYHPDDPEVQQMTQMARDQYELSLPNPKKQKDLQRVHDKVHADPIAVGPGPTTLHSHTLTGGGHVTGEVGFEHFSGAIEKWVGGGVNPDRPGELMNATAIHDATRWYRELPGMILGIMNGDKEKAAKVYLAWTYSQKSDSPMQGFIRTMKAYDRHQFATAHDMETFMRDDLGLAREAIAAVLEGRPVTSGLGIKLWDFSGAALGMNKRVVGKLMPAPSDRWAFRGAGFMDSQGLGQFMRGYGYRTAEEAGYFDPAPFVRPVYTKEVDDVTGLRLQKLDDNGEPVFRGDYHAYMKALDAENARRVEEGLPTLKRVYTSVGAAEYEYVTKWLNDMTAEANAAKWMGKTDWEARDLQALDWLRIQHAFGAYPESGADMSNAVLAQLTTSSDPMRQGEWGTHIEDWGQFTEQDVFDYLGEMGVHTAAALSERLGIVVPEVHHGRLGLLAGGPEVGPAQPVPMIHMTVVGTGETEDRAALSALAMNQAKQATVIREVPDFKTARVRGTKNGEEVELGFRHAIDFELGDKPRLAEQPTAAGYSSSGREVSAEELAAIRQRGQEYVDALPVQTQPLAYVDNNMLYQRTIKEHNPDKNYWGGATYDPKTGQFVLPERWMYHGTSGRFEQSIAQNGMTRGTFTFDSTDKSIVSGEGMVRYRVKQPNVTGPDKFDDWRHVQAPVPPEKLQISRDGGETWAPVVEGASFQNGPWTSAIGETTSFRAADLADKEAFDTAYRAFVKQNKRLLMKQDHYVGTFFDDEAQRIEFDVVVLTRTPEDTEAVQTAMGRVGGAYNVETGNGMFAARNMNETTRALAQLPTIKGTTLVPYRLADGTMGLRWVWNRIGKGGRVSSTNAAQVNKQILALREELNQAGLGFVRMNARSVHVKEFTHDWATDPKGYAISRRLEGLGDAGRGANRELFGGAHDQRGREVYRGASPTAAGGAEFFSQHVGGVSPLVGEFRDTRDTIVSRYLRNPVRGRANPDGAYVGDTGAVAEGVHGFTVAPPKSLSVDDLMKVQAMRDAGDPIGADNLRKVLEGYLDEAPSPEPVLRLRSPEAQTEQMLRRQPGAYIEWAGGPENISLVPFDSMMRLSGMRPSMFAFNDPVVNAAQHGLMERGFDKPIVLEYSLKDDSVRFMDKADRVFIEASDAADIHYLPATVVTVDEFPKDDAMWSGWQGENIFSPLADDIDGTPEIQNIHDTGGILSPERLGMAVDKGFAEGLESDAWQATHEVSQLMTAQAAVITKTPGYPTRGITEPATTLGPQHVRAVERMLEGIYDSPGGRVELYSGQRVMEGHARYENPEVGDLITMPLKAASPDREVAHRFAWGTNWEQATEPGFIFVFPEGTRGVVQDARVEIVTSGKFRVAKVEKMDPTEFMFPASEGEVVRPFIGRARPTGFGYDKRMTEPITVAHLEPEEIFNPHSKQWEPYHRTQPIEPDTSGMTLKFANDEVTRGAVTTAKDGRVQLWMGKSADAMTFAHEMAHAMHLHLDPSMQSRVLKAFNKENGRRLTRWNRDVSEWFADSYIRHLRAGSTVEDPELQRSYNYFARWMDKRIKGGVAKAETSKKGMQARGALSSKEVEALDKPMHPQTQALWEEMAAGPKGGAKAYNATEDSVWTAMTDAAKQAGYDAFRVNFFKRNRSLLERSVNHPMFGLYPASYMWGKVLPEMVRFIAKDPFGFPGGHVAWASHDIWRSIQQQTELDPEFAKQMDELGHNEWLRLISLTLPATPWEHAVNAPAWSRRIAQAGLENEARAGQGLEPKAIDLPSIWQDTMQYQFGAIPNAFTSITRGASGLEDLYAAARGEPTTGKGAPTIGQGLQDITYNIQQLTAPLGENIPSPAEIFGQSDESIDLLAQQDELQAELDDAQSQLQDVFTKYPFTQQ